MDGQEQIPLEDPAFSAPPEHDFSHDLVADLIYNKSLTAQQCRDLTTHLKQFGAADDEYALMQKASEGLYDAAVEAGESGTPELRLQKQLLVPPSARPIFRSPREITPDNVTDETLADQAAAVSEAHLGEHDPPPGDGTENYNPEADRDGINAMLDKNPSLGANREAATARAQMKDPIVDD